MLLELEFLLELQLSTYSQEQSEQDRDCALTDAGQLTFDQVDITVDDKAIAQSLCPTDLREYWLAERMRPGAAGGEEVPFEEVVANYVAQSIQKNISDFIGAQLIAQVTVANGAGNSGQTAASTLSTILDDLNDVYDALDERTKMKDDVVIFMSPANYRLAVRALVALNYFSYDFGNGQGDVFLPGTNAKLVKSSGFIGSDRFIAISSAYAIFATGLMDDAEQIRMIYDNVEDKVALRAYYRRGLSVYSVDQAAVNGSF